MKNKMNQNSPPDFDKIQKALAIEWQKKQSTADAPSKPTESTKNDNTTM